MTLSRLFKECVPQRAHELLMPSLICGGSASSSSFWRAAWLPRACPAQCTAILPGWRGQVTMSLFCAFLIALRAVGHSASPSVSASSEGSSACVSAGAWTVCLAVRGGGIGLFAHIAAFAAFQRSVGTQWCNSNRRWVDSHLLQKNSPDAASSGVSARYSTTTML